MTYSNLLIILAVLPGLFLMWKIYELDKIEKEPTKLLTGLFFAGMATIVSAVVLELVGQYVLAYLFSGNYDMYTGEFESSGVFYLYNFLLYFGVVACAEEGGKYFVLKKITWKNKEFDYRFDAVVYAVCVSLGFAIFENIKYAFTYGFATVLLRAVTAIPGHTIFAIFMGYFYGLAKQCEGYGDEAGKKKNLQLAYWVPVLIHGFYDFAASGASEFWAIIFFVFVIGLDIVAYKHVKNFSAADMKVAPDEVVEEQPAEPLTEEQLEKALQDPRMEELLKKYNSDSENVIKNDDDNSDDDSSDNKAE